MPNELSAERSKYRHPKKAFYVGPFCIKAPVLALLTYTTGVTILCGLIIAGVQLGPHGVLYLQSDWPCTHPTFPGQPRRWLPWPTHALEICPRSSPIGRPNIQADSCDMSLRATATRPARGPHPRLPLPYGNAHRRQ